MLTKQVSLVLLFCGFLAIATGYASPVQRRSTTHTADAGYGGRGTYPPSVTDNWLGGVGNWNNGSYWSTGFPPNSTDDVNIYSGGTDTVRLDTGSTTVNSLSLGGAANGYTSELTDGGVTQSLSVTNGLVVNENGLLSLAAASSTLNSNGQIFNYGTINSRGTINDSSLFYNSNATFNNYGTVNASGFVTDGGTVNNNSGATVNVGGYSVSGATSLNNSGTLNVSTVYNGGSIRNNSRGTINLGGVLNNDEFGGLTNDGTINSNGSLQNDEYAGGIYNSGTINNAVDIISQAGFFNIGTINNNSGSYFGNWYYARFYNYGSLNNYGNIYNSGLFYNYGSLNNHGTIQNVLGDLNGYTTIYNYGTITNASGTSVSNSAAIINAGAFVIASGASLTNQVEPSVNYTQSAGSTIVDGLFSSPTPIQINGGSLSGSGMIQGDIMMGGTLSPGDSPGVLTVQGSYTQLASGTFKEEIAGLAQGTQYDQLMVDGAVSLDGALLVKLLDGYVPALGSTYQFLYFTPGDLTGTFASIEDDAINGSERWVVIYDNRDGYIELQAAPVPEPSSFLLLGSGLLGLTGMMRRKLTG